MHIQMYSTEDIEIHLMLQVYYFGENQYDFLDVDAVRDMDLGDILLPQNISDAHRLHINLGAR
jgi:hypothetical protein